MSALCAGPWYAAPKSSLIMGSIQCTGVRDLWFIRSCQSPPDLQALYLSPLFANETNDLLELIDIRRIITRASADLKLLSDESFNRKLVPRAWKYRLWFYSIEPAVCDI
jgi:hypothetical protein